MCVVRILAAAVVKVCDTRKGVSAVFIELLGPADGTVQLAACMGGGYTNAEKYIDILPID